MKINDFDLPAMLDKASKEHRAGRLAEAEARYHEILAARPDSGEALAGLGNVFREQRKFDEAIAAYQKALIANPDLFKTYNNLGALYHMRGKLDEAIVCFKRAVEIKPDHVDAYNNLGRTFTKLRDLESAKICYLQAVTLKPDYVVAHNNVAAIFMGQGYFEEAWSHYQQALAADPNSVIAQVGAGNIYQTGGKINEAVACYERALAIKPDYGLAYNYLGVALKNRGDLAGAVGSFRRSLELLGDFPEGCFNLGGALAQMGQQDEAVISLRRYLELDPVDSLGARLILAKVEGGALPEKASPAHMQNIYAQRAAYWDKDAEQQKSYRGHRLITKALSQLSDGGLTEILDAGCGTGLVGTLVRGRAKWLEGIDLSPAMVKKAEAARVYDRLHCGDLVEFMNNCGRQYDVILSAATLIHFGDLEPVFRAVSKTLRDDGLFIATLFPNEEKDGEEGFCIASLNGFAQAGCYTHGREYVAKVAKACGLNVAMLDAQTHEYWKGTPVPGLVMGLRR